MKISKQFIKNSVFILALLSFSFGFAQFEIPEKPDFQTSVYDYINLLSASEKNTLENKLVKYSDR